MKDTIENYYKELNKKISKVRNETTEEHVKLNRKIIEVSNQVDSERPNEELVQQIRGCTLMTSSETGGVGVPQKGDSW